MLVLLVSLFSFLVLLSLNRLPSWANELRLFPHLLCREFLYIVVCWLKNSRHIASAVLEIPSAMSAKKKVVPMAEVAEETAAMSVLDLPDLTLECILGKLPPASLSNMAAVCSSLKDICRSDHIWERHMKEKWGAFLGPAAQREWQAYVSSRKEKDHSRNPAGGEKAKGYLEFLSCMLPFSWMRPKVDDGGTAKTKGSVLLGSTMSWYLALENGRFWFPAQVYNRENGHVGFLLSCYDAELSYDSRTNTFHARYPPHGRRTVVIEEGVQWDRLRAPPINTPAHDLHVSDCLNDLHPGDHIEIQWRRNKEFPYGWWYGVVGHLESCDRNERHCHCHDSDTVVLEFKQYTVGSRWRQTIINRKEHQEEGNEADGFYGGIRKLENEEEIGSWRRLWPNDILE